MIKTKISLFIASLFILGILISSLPIEHNFGVAMAQPAQIATCCEFQGECFNLFDPNNPDGPVRKCPLDGLRTGMCNEVSQMCVEDRNVPTLSQWGLIATAGLLGIIGFIIIRRRQLTTNS